MRGTDPDIRIFIDGITDEDMNRLKPWPTGRHDGVVPRSDANFQLWVVTRDRYTIEYFVSDGLSTLAGPVTIEYGKDEVGPEWLKRELKRRITAAGDAFDPTTQLGAGPEVRISRGR